MQSLNIAELSDTNQNFEGNNLQSQSLQTPDFQKPSPTVVIQCPSDSVCGINQVGHTQSNEIDRCCRPVNIGRCQHSKLDDCCQPVTSSLKNQEKGDHCCRPVKEGHCQHDELYFCCQHVNSRSIKPNISDCCCQHVNSEQDNLSINDHISRPVKPLSEADSVCCPAISERSQLNKGQSCCQPDMNGHSQLNEADSCWQTGMMDSRQLSEADSCCQPNAHGCSQLNKTSSCCQPVALEVRQLNEAESCCQPIKANFNCQPEVLGSGECSKIHSNCQPIAMQHNCVRPLVSGHSHSSENEVVPQGFSTPNEIKISNEGCSIPNQIKISNQGYSTPNEIKISMEGCSSPNEIKMSKQGCNSPSENMISNNGCKEPLGIKVTNEGCSQPNETSISIKGCSQSSESKISIEGHSQPNESKIFNDGHSQPIESKIFNEGNSQPIESKIFNDSHSQPIESKILKDGHSQPNESRISHEGYKSQTNETKDSYQDVKTLDNSCKHKINQLTGASIRQLDNLEKLNNIQTMDNKHNVTIVNDQLRQCPYKRICSEKQCRPCKMKDCNKFKLYIQSDENSSDMTYTKEELYLDDMFSENTEKKDKSVENSLQIANILHKTEATLSELYTSRDNAKQSQSNEVEISDESQSNETKDAVQGYRQPIEVNDTYVHETQGYSQLKTVHNCCQLSFIANEIDIHCPEICKAKNAQYNSLFSDKNSIQRDIDFIQSQLLAEISDPKDVHSHDQIPFAQNCNMIPENCNVREIEALRSDISEREIILESVICDITYSNDHLYLDRLFSEQARNWTPVKESGLILKPEIQSRKIQKGHAVRQMISMTQFKDQISNMNKNALQLCSYSELFPRISCHRQFTFCAEIATLVYVCQKLCQRVYGKSMSKQHCLLSMTKYRICDNSLAEYRPD